jgi:hypothetical protein
MSQESSLPMPGPLVAVAGWLIPGAGYWVLGQRARGLVIGLTIIGLFLLGIFVAGIRVVDAPDLIGKQSPTGDTSETRLVQAQPTLVRRVLDKPWFIGQVLTGPLGIVSAWASSHAAANPATASIKAHSRIAEIGTLYTAVAGMLNLMAMLDAASRASPKPVDVEGEAA